MRQFTTTTSPLPLYLQPISAIAEAPFVACGIAAVIFTGTEDGTYSSTGLSIDAVSGDINTGTSTAGTYTVATQ